MKLDIKYTLHKNYTLPKGAYSPYFDALARGDVLAHTCETCRTTYFPPRLCCGGTYNFRTIQNTATVLYRTDAPDTAFALVRFAGCENGVIARIVNPKTRNPKTLGDRCHLIPPPDASAAVFVCIEKG